ncbi:MAG TPA: glycosyltransferase family 39 protein, partial [Ilumatobacteraceae bacterium]
MPNDAFTDAPAATPTAAGAPERLAIGGVVAVSVVANVWGLARVGWGNAYYAAAVRSMGTSWHDFLYGSFDRGGYVSVDKPPFSLWVDVVSTKLFGFSRYSVLGPEVLAGALAVWLLYWALRRTWGRTAGLVAAAALAVMPINVAVSHSNNTDAVLVLLMTAAAAVGIEAIRRGSLRWLLGACVLAGCAMTAKMLAAAPVMPGILIAYAWCAAPRLRRRLWHAGIGLVVMAVAGLWWFAAVQLTPAGARPYVGSTQTNSVFELAFERNGVNQVEGPSGSIFGLGKSSASATTRAAATSAVRPIAFGVAVARGAAPAPVSTSTSLSSLGFTGGPAGPLRLFDEELGTQVAWLGPLAVAGIIGAVISTRIRRSARLGAVIVMTTWLAAGAVVYSATKGVLHPYYLAGIGPPVACLAGIAIAT